jgi:hypothetical protein
VVGGCDGGDVMAVGVVLIRDSRAHNPHYIIFGAKVQKIFDICKIFVFTKIIERSRVRNSFAFRYMFFYSQAVFSVFCA